MISEMAGVTLQGPVRDLMVQLAEEDAGRGVVNEMLYARSATYQHTLDGLLGDAGKYVLPARDRRYHVRERAA
jgi:hypothetical protein